jgi:hypothetical protein
MRKKKKKKKTYGSKTSDIDAGEKGGNARHRLVCFTQPFESGVGYRNTRFLGRNEFRRRKITLRIYLRTVHRYSTPKRDQSVSMSSLYRGVRKVGCFAEIYERLRRSSGMVKK